MKFVARLVGIILVVAAVVHFVMPADALPSFLPGHEAGLDRIRHKHGIASGAVGVVLLFAGWFLGRSKA